jgi:ribonuclease E
VKREIVFSEADDLAVVFENGRAVEFVMRQGDQLVGDIILGRVESVVPAIEAAFVNIGHDKNGFIHLADLPQMQGPKRKSKTPSVKPGEKLVVQIAKAPTGTKGARLTGRLSIPGRFLVFVPHDNRVCLSRMITDGKERDRLRAIASELKDPGHGLIVRTEAAGASEAELRRDIQELLERWTDILHQAQMSQPPALLYRDQDLLTRVLRDRLTADTERVVFDNEAAFQRAKAILSGWMPEMVRNLQVYRGRTPLLHQYRIPQEFENALKPTVRLPSGGSIVIEATEALTVIDVNSGKLTSSKSLNETVLRTNLEASVEIARQIRLRDIGGIVIVDFISMDYAADRQKVIAHFNEALAPDKSRPQITAAFSEHGLLELSRRRQGQSILEQLTHRCPECQGLGRVRNEVTPFEIRMPKVELKPETAEEQPEVLVEELVEEPILEQLGTEEPVSAEEAEERRGRRRRRRRRRGRGPGEEGAELGLAVGEEETTTTEESYEEEGLMIEPFELEEAPEAPAAREAAPRERFGREGRRERRERPAREGRPFREERPAREEAPVRAELPEVEEFAVLEEFEELPVAPAARESREEREERDERRRHRRRERPVREGRAPREEAPSRAYEPRVEVPAPAPVAPVAVAPVVTPAPAEVAETATTVRRREGRSRVPQRPRTRLVEVAPGLLVAADEAPEVTAETAPQELVPTVETIEAKAAEALSAQAEAEVAQPEAVEAVAEAPEAAVEPEAEPKPRATRRRAPARTRTTAAKKAEAAAPVAEPEVAEPAPAEPEAVEAAPEAEEAPARPARRRSTRTSTRTRKTTVTE